MRKKIGIILPSSKSGGIFQYALGIASSLINYADEFDCYLIHYKSDGLDSIKELKSDNLHFISIPEKKIFIFRKAIHFLGLIFGIDFFLIKNSHMNSLKDKIDILIFPAPFSFDYFSKIPYVVTIPDLMHRYYPQFSEYRLRQRITRDIVYGYYAKNSVLNIVDSEQGLEDLHNFFRIKENRIKIVYYRPPGYIYKYKNMNFEEADDLLKKYNIPEKFIFYPAQFWEHKNHLRLIKALHIIKEKRNVKIHLVLVGRKEGNYASQFKKVSHLIEELNMRDQIIHLGYVSDKEIVALYKKSLALVFCSLGGPTNIPPLEAMVLGTPVICSNLFDMPKQLGEAGILFNPFNSKDMAEKIYKVWTDEPLRQELIKNGFEKMKNLNLETCAKQWQEVLKKVLYGK